MLRMSMRTTQSTFSSRSVLKPFSFQKSWFSGGKIGDEGSDPDFQSTSKLKEQAVEGDEIHGFLDKAVKDHSVLLFMKGSPTAPMCGFSAKVTQILQSHGIDFSSADVLSSIEVREGIKKYSDWPTIPQLYVKGEFVGGCDIVSDLDSSGELKELLGPILEEQKKKTKEET